MNVAVKPCLSSVAWQTVNELECGESGIVHGAECIAVPVRGKNSLSAAIEGVPPAAVAAVGL